MIVIPSHVQDTDTLVVLLNELRKFDRQSKSAMSPVAIIQLVLTFLAVIRNQSFKYLTTLQFISEQLHLMTMRKVEYSTDLVVTSSLLCNISPRGYRFLREKKWLIVPSLSTIRRVFISKPCSPAFEQHNSSFLAYINQKSKSLQTVDRTVTLMIDEIHLKPYFGYAGGSVIGSAFDSNEAATSAYAFMVGSVLSQFRDVVHIIPVKSIKAETLHNMIRRVIIGLEKIGLKVVCVITDNNAINSKAMSFFATPPLLSIVYIHPVDKSRPLFFMFDSIHILMCVRNHWLGQKMNLKQWFSRIPFHWNLY